MQKWEYLVVAWDDLYRFKPDTAQKYLDDLGEKGWELVSVTSFQETSGTIQTNLYTAGDTSGNIKTDMHCKLIFKRPKV